MSRASEGRSTRVTLLRGEALSASPWKNGGGVTREIAAWPAHGASLDTFAWRASVVQIARPGPFSHFAGVERTLVLLEGARLRLDETPPDGGVPRTHALTRVLDLARFDGAAQIDAQIDAPAGGAAHVFNLMVRRGAAHGALDIWSGPARRSVCAETLLLHAVQDAPDVRVDGMAPVALAAGDTMRVAAAGAVCIDTRGAGTLIVVALDSASSSVHAMRDSAKRTSCAEPVVPVTNPPLRGT
jgi:environmental stress-induced protein Ves